jgi:hypothetical protein
MVGFLPRRLAVTWRDTKDDANRESRGSKKKNVLAKGFFSSASLNFPFGRAHGRCCCSFSPKNVIQASALTDEYF